MKICNNENCEKAGELQPEENFHWRTKGESRYGTCKTCRNNVRSMERKSLRDLKERAQNRKTSELISMRW